MSKNKELVKNTLIIFVGKFCTQFLIFLLIPIYTRYLLVADYGYVDLIQTYISLLVPIIILRFDSAVFRFLIDARDKENEKSIIISSTILMLSIQLIIFIILFFVVNYFFDFNYALAILVNMIFVALSSVLLQVTRGIGDNIGYSIGSIISAIITLVLNITFIVCLKYNASYILISSSIANLICTMYLILKNKLYKFIKVSFIKVKYLKKMFAYSIPMIPDGLSWWIMNVSDRTIVSACIGMATNGIYSVSCKFSNILSSLFQIFNMSWQESASVHINDEDRDQFFSNVFNTVTRIFFSVCTIIIAVLPLFFNVLIGRDYMEAYIYIPILLLGNVFNASANIIGATYIAKKNTKQVAKTTMFAAIINILINIIFIRNIGLWAAVLSTLISYIIITIYRFIDSRKYVKISINFKELFYMFLIYVFSVILYNVNNNILNYVNLVIVVLLCAIINKKEIQILMHYRK